MVNWGLVWLELDEYLELLGYKPYGKNLTDYYKGNKIIRLVEITKMNHEFHITEYDKLIKKIDFKAKSHNGLLKYLKAEYRKEKIKKILEDE